MSLLKMSDSSLNEDRCENVLVDRPALGPTVAVLGRATSETRRSCSMKVRRIPFRYRVLFRSATIRRRGVSGCVVLIVAFVLATLWTWRL